MYEIDNIFKSGQTQATKQCRAVFEWIDADASELLETEEIITCLLGVGCDFEDEQLIAAARQMDGDTSGYVDYNEFEEWWLNPKMAAMRKGMFGQLLQEVMAEKHYQNEVCFRFAYTSCIVCPSFASDAMESVVESVLP